MQAFNDQNTCISYSKQSGIVKCSCYHRRAKKDILSLKKQKYVKEGKEGVFVAISVRYAKS